MATWIRSLSANLNGSANTDLTGSPDVDNDTAPGDFDPANVNSVRFQWTVDVLSGTFVDDSYQTDDVILEVSPGGTQLAKTVGEIGTLQSGTTSVSFDDTDLIPSTTASTGDWEGANLGTGANAFAEFIASMKADGVAVRIAASSVTITIDYTPSVAATVYPPFPRTQRTTVRM
jgi:hypothetical protein